MVLWCMLYLVESVNLGFPWCFPGVFLGCSLVFLGFPWFFVGSSQFSLAGSLLLFQANAVPFKASTVSCAPCRSWVPWRRSFRWRRRCRWWNGPRDTRNAAAGTGRTGRCYEMVMACGLEWYVHTHIYIYNYRIIIYIYRERERDWYIYIYTHTVIDVCLYVYVSRFFIYIYIYIHKWMCIPLRIRGL